MTEPEYHIASFVVHSKPLHTTNVSNALSKIEGVEVHAEKQGKLVVTAEGENVQQLAKLTDTIQLIPGILSVAPVYHEFTEHEKSTPDNC